MILGMDRGPRGPRSRASCPICASAMTPSSSISWENLTWWTCPACGGGWREPYVAETESSDEETSGTYGRYLDNMPLFETIAGEKAKWIRSTAPLNTVSVLEVGPGAGAVADALVRDGLPRARYAAVESNAAFADALEARGFVVFRGPSPEALRAAAAFHNREGRLIVVLLDNVLEHVPGPRDFLVSLRDALEVPFVVLIEVPNEKGLPWRAPLQDVLRGIRKPPTFPGHINLFTRGSLEGLLADVFDGGATVRSKGLRHVDEVRRLLQSETVPFAVRAVLALLRAVPVDRALGVAYFLRAEARGRPSARSSRAAPTNGAQGTEAP